MFDLDGTLLDTSEGILSSVRYIIDKAGLPPLDEAELKTFIGPPIQNSLRRRFGLTPEKAMELGNAFRERYKETDLLKAVPYPGIYELLGGLRAMGLRAAVATYKREDYAVDLLAHFGFLPYFDLVRGSDPAGQLTKADIIRQCIRDLQVRDQSKAVLVGDTLSDAQGAKDAGISFIAAGYGFGYRPKDTVEDAITVIAEPLELLRRLG